MAHQQLRWLERIKRPNLKYADAAIIEDEVKYKRRMKKHHKI